MEDKRAQTVGPEKTKQEAMQKLLEKMDIRRWEKKLDDKTAPMILETLQNVIYPWMRMSESIGDHLKRQVAPAMAIANRVGGENPSEEAQSLIKRISILAALREDVDVYIAEKCEGVLEDLERGIFG